VLPEDSLLDRKNSPSLRQSSQVTRAIYSKQVREKRNKVRNDDRSPRENEPTQGPELGGGDEDFAGAARGRLLADDDLDVPVERGEKLHEPFHRKPVQAVIG
jgi:hypothetical protein